MQTMKRVRWMLALTVLAAGIGACKPKTAAQKIEDKAEDAAHEIKQGAERTGERIEDATHKK